MPCITCQWCSSLCKLHGTHVWWVMNCQLNCCALELNTWSKKAEMKVTDQWAWSMETLQGMLGFHHYFIKDVDWIWFQPICPCSLQGLILWGQKGTKYYTSRILSAVNKCSDLTLTPPPLPWKSPEYFRAQKVDGHAQQDEKLKSKNKTKTSSFLGYIKKKTKGKSLCVGMYIGYIHKV